MRRLRNSVCRRALRLGRVKSFRTLRMHSWKRWHRPVIEVASEPHDRRCRSARSIDRSRGPRFCRRGDARRRSRQRLGHRHLIRSEPTIWQDYRMVRDRCRPASACTIHTTLRACRQSGNDAHRHGDDGSGGGDSSDNGGGDDVIEPRHSIQTSKLKLLQPWEYASWISLVLGRPRIWGSRKAAAEGNKWCPAARD